MNLFYVKSDIKNFLKNTVYRLKYRIFNAQKLNTYYCVFEPQKKHAGLADRLKSVIHQYNLAKAYGYEFKLYWETPFCLSDYLVPKNDWICKLEDLEYSLIDTKIISEVSWRKMPQLKINKQYHCYRYSGNLLPRVFEDTGYKWCDLFNELFTPSKLLLDSYEDLKLVEKSYVAVHLRFVNALENFENTYFNNHLDTQEERDCLIKKCKQGINEIIADNKGKDIYIFSDSKVFLNSLSDMPVKTLDSTNVGHISENSNQFSQLKTFLDLWVMSKASKIYRIQAPELFQWSYYAVLAATIGDIELIDKKV